MVENPLQKSSTGKYEITKMQREAVVSPEDLLVREKLISQMRRMPDEAFTRVQNIQGEIGCVHGCAFCSQGAGGDITHFTQGDIRNLIAATVVVAKEVAERYPYPERIAQYGLIGYDRVEHKPGVIFPYFDNDPFSYLHLDELIGGLHQELGNKVRISTVGYSRKNGVLQSMHEGIVDQYTKAFDGLRFSFSRYPRGWTDLVEYKADFVNTLRTYKPVVDYLGPGKEQSAVEIRYAPNLGTERKPLDNTIINNRHVLRSGQFLLVGTESFQDLQESRIIGVDGRKALTSLKGYPYSLFISDEYILNGDWEAFATYIINNQSNTERDFLSPMDGFENSVLTKQSSVHLFMNADGPYYVADPSFQEDGTFHALQLYMQTSTRKVSGYLDTTRYFLNAMLEYKKENGIGRREDFLDAKWENADEVISRLIKFQQYMAKYDFRTAYYIDKEVLGLILPYREILEDADYSPNFFFNRFTIDTGIIVNQGRALAQFRGLASLNDMPLTPQEERGYGDGTSIASGRGRVWRWSPSPYLQENEESKVSLTGAKNNIFSRGVLTARELDYHTLTEFTPNGDPLRVEQIEGFELNKITGENARTLFISHVLKEKL